MRVSNESRETFVALPSRAMGVCPAGGKEVGLRKGSDRQGGRGANSFSLAE